MMDTVTHCTPKALSFPVPKGLLSLWRRYVFQRERILHCFPYSLWCKCALILFVCLSEAPFHVAMGFHLINVLLIPVLYQENLSLFQFFDCFFRDYRKLHCPLLQCALVNLNDRWVPKRNLSITLRYICRVHMHLFSIQKRRRENSPHMP